MFEIHVCFMNHQFVLSFSIVFLFLHLKLRVSLSLCFVNLKDDNPPDKSDKRRGRGEDTPQLDKAQVRVNRNDDIEKINRHFNGSKDVGNPQLYPWTEPVRLAEQ